MYSVNNEKLYDDIMIMEIKNFCGDFLYRVILSIYFYQDYIKNMDAPIILWASLLFVRCTTLMLYTDHPLPNTYLPEIYW